MTPAALWVTWTQPHKIITAAISNYQSQLIQSACFTLHNGPIIGFLYLSVSLWQLIFQWNRCMPASGTSRLKNRLVLWMVMLCGCESAPTWFCLFFHCCSMQNLLRIRSEVSPHLSVHACSDQLERLSIQVVIVTEDHVRREVGCGWNKPTTRPLTFIGIYHCFSILLLQQMLLGVSISWFGRDVASVPCIFRTFRVSIGEAAG